MRTIVMLGLYLAGFVGAMTTAWLLKSSILKSSDAPFILELPQYRMPTLRSLALRLVDRARVFLRQAGTIILCVTMALWVMAHLPVLHTATGAYATPELADSVIGRMGHFIEPAIAPLGFNWKIGIGLLSSVLAREVMVSTMGTLYGADADTHALSLQTALHHDMTLGGAMALMIFFAFAMQCTSTMAVVRRETNSWKWRRCSFSTCCHGLRRGICREPRGNGLRRIECSKWIERVSGCCFQVFFFWPPLQPSLHNSRCRLQTLAFAAKLSMSNRTPAP